MRVGSWLKNLLVIFTCIPQFTKSDEERKCRPVAEIKIPRHFYVDQYDLSLRIESSSRTSHLIVSNIAKILLNEVIGYPHVYVHVYDRDTVGDNITRTLQKISTCTNTTYCEPVDVYGPEMMINLEVWLYPGFNMVEWVDTGRIEDCGPIGPVGRSGWYIADHTVEYYWGGNNTILDHYKAFTNPEIAGIFDLSQESFIMTLSNKYCKLKECGVEGIYRSPWCQKSDYSCATLLADYPASNFELLKKVIEKYKLLVNVAWVGKELEDIIEARTLADKKTLFFHKTPMILNSVGQYTQVSFPNCEDDKESSCDFEITQLQKVVWSKIKTHANHAFHVLKAMTFSQAEYSKLLKEYKQLKSRGFNEWDVACSWIRINMYGWDKWIPVDNSKKTTLYIGGIFPLKGIYWRQGNVLPAAQMAATDINLNDTLLANYTIEILEQDGHCAADEVMKSFINYVTNATYKTMVGILGPACSDTVEPIAGVAKHFNSIIISYSAEGALFSREKYPYFFRTIPENNQFKYVYLKLFEKLGYTRVAALTEDGQRYPEYISHLQDLMQERKMSFIVNRKFPRERESLIMRPYLEDLKEKGARIIIGDFYDYAAKAVMCEAYKLGMTAVNGYLWFLPLWFLTNWNDTDDSNDTATDQFGPVTCTSEQMFEAINGHISLAYKFYADDGDIMQEGKNVSEWLTMYEREAKKKNRKISHYGGYAYDAVWVYALALDALLKENNSHISTLHQSKTSRRLVELLNETRFNGVTGPLYFLGSSRISDVIIWQFIDNRTRQIGIYHPSSQTDGTLEINETDIEWLTPNGKKPDDGSKEFSSCAVEGIRNLLHVTCDVALIIVNIMALCLFAILIVSVIIIYKRRYDKRMKRTETRMKQLGLMPNSEPFALDEWEMPRDQIVINRKLGEGAFGTVFGGEAKIQNQGWIAVAVKTLKNGAKPEEKLDFLSEAEVMKQFEHINIVKLVGVCTMGEPVYTVMEFMLYGDLKTYLLSRRNLAAEKDRTNNDEVSDKRLTNMALDIARGLSYLADKKYIHRDLACRNCLVNISRSVKIGDFGMCRAMYDSDYYRYNKKGMLPVRWMAPESLTDGLFTPMSDVWSYGVVLYEIVTFASVPYQGLSNTQVLEHIKQYKTLPVPKGVKPMLNSLLLQCWSKFPKDRIQAAEIVEILAQNPELVTPCLDLPTSSVEMIDSGTLELTNRDHTRVHSLSSVWPNRKNTLHDQTQIGLFESTHINVRENGGILKHSGLKLSNKKTFHESFRKKRKKDFSKDKHLDLPQSTNL